MTSYKENFPALLVLLALGGCATLPSGPSVMVLPSQGKPFELFQEEDASCRNWAQQQIGPEVGETVNNSSVAGAAVGTVVGAGIGALFGAAAGNPAAGAAIGAGSGLLVGTAAGSDAGRSQGYEAQRRYDTSYIQCMYAKGNQVPGVRSTGAGYRRHRASQPPPSRGYEPVPSVPPDYRPEPYDRY